MKRNIAILGLVIIILLLIIIVLKNTSQRFDDINFVEKKAEDLKPISKESAKNILKSEFGWDVINTEDDFKEEGDYYIVDVKISIESSEEHIHTEDELSTDGIEITGDGNHIMNIGVHKINKYTGELEE